MARRVPAPAWAITRQLRSQLASSRRYDRADCAPLAGRWASALVAYCGADYAGPATVSSNRPSATSDGKLIANPQRAYANDIAHLQG